MLTCLIVLLVPFIFASSKGTPFGREPPPVVSEGKHFRECNARCGLRVAPAQTRMLNGDEIEPWQTPWSAKLTIIVTARCDTLTSPVEVGWESTCSASILSPRFLLSAAHCFRGVTFKHERCSTAVTVDAIAKNVAITTAGGQKATAKTLHIHTDYTTNDANDIALIEVDGTLTFSRTTRSVCLAISNRKFFEEREVTMTGYGKDSTGKFGTLKADVLTVPLKTGEQCKNEFLAFDPELNYCGVARNGGALGGDSGGPLVADYAQVYFQFGLIKGGKKEQKHVDDRIADRFVNTTTYCEWIALQTSRTVTCVSPIEIGRIVDYVCDATVWAKLD